MRKLIVVITALAGLVFGIGWIVTMPRVVTADALAARSVDLGNGRTMFFAGGCASCHATPGQDDRMRLGGGLALTSPFGTFFVPNISPDTTDGIGKWSEAQFVTAMLKGTSPKGEHYYPAFPYASYQHMRLDDVRDLFAYLRTLPAVAGRQPDHELGFPFNIRRGVGVWKALYLDGKPFVSDASQSEEWNRGSYLVNGPAHCAECHSPRNALGGIIAGQRFAGGPNPEGPGWVPNITQKALGTWSTKDIAYLLESGDTPDGDSVGGPMAPVIRNTSQLPEADRVAMAVFLKSLPPVDGPARPLKK